jgi:hypothetical protein
LGIIDSSEHVELQPELILPLLLLLLLLLLLVQLLLLIQFFVRIKCGDLNGERLLPFVVDALKSDLAFSQIFRVMRGVVA